MDEFNAYPSHIEVKVSGLILTFGYRQIKAIGGMKGVNEVINATVDAYTKLVIEETKKAKGMGE